MKNNRTIHHEELPAASMGNMRRLTVIRYGGRSHRRKAYVQAGLHADEAPGFLVMHHLIEKLDRAADAGAVTGEIVLVPVANPIGVAQWRDDGLQGRFDFADGINFNRQHIDLAAEIAERIEGRLTGRAAQNVRLIRNAAGDILAGIRPQGEAEHLKHRLLSLSHDADIVLDLHCDYQAVLHIYLGTPLWPDASDLSAQMGAEVTLLAPDSGVTPFDEACSRIWWQLAERFPDHPIPSACLSATVELRGLRDVTHDLAAEDAENILRFLARRGFLQGHAADPPRLRRQPTPLAGVEHIKATGPGVVVFLKKPGQRVRKGEAVAEVIDPQASDPAKRQTLLCSTTGGILFAHSADRFARPGRILAKIAGKTPLEGKSRNLLTL